MTYILIHLYDCNFKPIVIIWKPVQAVLLYTKRKIETRTTLVDAFCTFFLLSNTKLLSACVDLLIPVTVYELNSTGTLSYSWRLYYNATMPYFGQHHLPYAILAMAMLLLFVLFPVLLLTLYPFRWFQKFLNLFPVRWYVLHTFMDSFQGCYKDGTEPGTRDYRWCASVFFIVRYLLYVLHRHFDIQLHLLSDCYNGLSIHRIAIYSPAALQAKCKKTDTATHYVHPSPSLGYTGAIGTSLAKGSLLLPFLAILLTAAVLPLLYLSAIILHWGYTNRTFGWDMIRKLKAKRCGYEIL